MTRPVDPGALTGLIDRTAALIRADLAPERVAAATGLLCLATIGAGIALALRAERASRLVAEGCEVGQ